MKTVKHKSARKNTTQKGDSLGDRMKRYESVPRISLSPRIPVVVRLDGRAFHTFTASFPRPFDTVLQLTMVEAAKSVAEEMQGFKLGYTQSDEVSLVMTDYDTLQTSPWFDYDQQKVATIAASIMTAHFNRALDLQIDRFNAAQGSKWDSMRAKTHKLAYFDGRAYNVPREDVANYFLWRAKDWERNSLTMYASSFFSHKQLHGKTKQDRHDMLHSIGKNWATDVDARSKNGTFFDAEGQEMHLPADYAIIAELVEPLVNPGKPKPLDPAVEAEAISAMADLVLSVVGSAEPSRARPKFPGGETPHLSNAQLNSGWIQGSSGPDARGWRS
jgi:tRNA(His) guanylyltransferase